MLGKGRSEPQRYQEMMKSHTQDLRNSNFPLELNKSRIGNHSRLMGSLLKMMTTHKVDEAAFRLKGKTFAITRTSYSSAVRNMAVTSRLKL